MEIVVWIETSTSGMAQETMCGLGIGFVDLPSARCVFRRADVSFHSVKLVDGDDLLIIKMTEEGVEHIIRKPGKLYKLWWSARVEYFLRVHLE